MPARFRVAASLPISGPAPARASIWPDWVSGFGSGPMEPDVCLPAEQAAALPGGVIAAYGSMADPQPQVPFYPLMFNHVTIRTMLVYLLSPGERARVTVRFGRARSC